jgi:hypothetical protein
VLEAGAVEADMPMWGPRQWRVGRVVLVAGQGGVGGSLGGQVGPKAAVFMPGRWRVFEAAECV